MTEDDVRRIVREEIAAHDRGLMTALRAAPMTRLSIPDRYEPITFQTPRPDDAPSEITA
jgi:hypothetical protein